MPHFHHANIGLLPEQEEAVDHFLVEVLGYRRIEAPEEIAELARWYGDDDGLEIHLSLDPEHRPASKAHTAVAVDEVVEARLQELALVDDTFDLGDGRIHLCRDPAGNLWELRVAV